MMRVVGVMRMMAVRLVCENANLDSRTSGLVRVDSAWGKA